MKIILIALLFISKVSFGGIINVGDTTLAANWNAGGNVLNITGKISGTAIISNAIINANLFIQIFDTTISIGASVYCDKFSAMWYGTKSTNADNYNNLQKSINACINTNYPLYIPGIGIYTYSQPLMAVLPNGSGNYLQVRLNMYGDATFWNSLGGTILKYTGNSYGIVFQQNKGSEIHHLVFQGGWVSPGGSDTSYYNLALASYTNQAASGNGWGIAIDPLIPLTGNSGSTGLSFHDIKVEKFSHLIEISNSVTQNAEILIFENIQLGDGQIGVETNQAQEKGNVFRGIYCWGSLHTLFTIGHAGRFQSGNYYIDGANIAGRVIRLFWIAQGGFFPSHISNIYAENIGIVGTFNASVPLSIKNCVFDMILPTIVGYLDVVNSAGSSNQPTFQNCMFRYYGAGGNMRLVGSSTYENCFIPHTIVGGTTNVFITRTGGVVNTSATQILYTNIIDTISYNPIKITIRR